MILISSEEDELVSLCDRIEVFRNGSIVGEVFPQEGDCDKELMQLILGLNVWHYLSLSWAQSRFLMMWFDFGSAA